jgi:hypothetical protein
VIIIYYPGIILETLKKSVISQASQNSNLFPPEYDERVANRKDKQPSNKHVEA